MFIFQWVGIVLSGVFVWYSFKHAAKARNSLAETRASLAKMEECNKQLEKMNKDFYLGTCCQCGMQKELVCNDCLGVGKSEQPPKYRSIDEP